MIITIDTSEALSDFDSTILSAMVGQAATQPTNEEKFHDLLAFKEAKMAEIRKQLAAGKDEPEEEDKEDKEEKPKRTRRTKAEMEAARAAEAAAKEPQEDDEPQQDPLPEAEESEDVDGPSEDAGEYTLTDAVQRATALLAEGKTAVVKEALAAVGAKRGGDVKPGSLPAFMKALG